MNLDQSCRAEVVGVVEVALAVGVFPADEGRAVIIVDRVERSGIVDDADEGVADVGGGLVP